MTPDDKTKKMFEEYRKQHDKRDRYPADMGFFPFSNKMAENVPLKTPWLPEYYSQRSLLEHQGTSSRDELRALLRRLGADNSDLIDRYRGTLLGGAIGDALGMPLEGALRDSRVVRDLEAGGALQLPRGAWTDETSMTCCAAYSLLNRGGFDATHQLQSLSYWYRYGAYSSVESRVVDIGQSVKRALDAFLASGSTEPDPFAAPSAGNASLTRVAPMVLFYLRNFDDCIEYAEKSSRLTHSAPEAIDACRYFAALLYGALNGESKAALLRPHYAPLVGFWEKHPLCPAIEEIASGEYKKKSRDQIVSSPYVVHTLEAALWTFERSSDFEHGALEAVNLAGDADAVGAVFGQLAGAHYGEMTLPYRWIKHLESSHGFYHFAQDLKQAAASTRQEPT